MAQTIGNMGPLAVRMAKKAINEGYEVGLKTGRFLIELKNNEFIRFGNRKTVL